MISLVIEFFLIIRIIFLIFYFKHYVFNKKVNTSRPTKNEFLQKFKFALQTEKYLSKEHTKSVLYNAYKIVFGICTMLSN